MKTLTIAISGINATDNPGPGIPVAKSLKFSSINCRLFGLSYDINDPGHYLTNILDGSYILPHPSKGWNAIEEQIIALKEAHGLDIIIPCLDAELPIFIQNEHKLSEMGIKTLLPNLEQFQYRNKENLAELADKIDVNYPEIAKITSYSGLHSAMKDFKFPFMIKGPFYKAYPVHNEHDAERHFTDIANEWGFPILLQKIVHGEELNVVGVGDGEGNTLGMVAIKKQTTTSLGKIWSGITIHNEPLLEAARKFVKQTKWTGPFELECIVNNDCINLLEINPRFPAWIYFATGVGINLPERLVKHLEHLPADNNSDYPCGKILMRFTDEIIGDLSILSNLVTMQSHHCV